MNVFDALGDAVGQRLTRSELESVTDLLERVSAALVYLAELPAAGEGAEDYRADSDELDELIDALRSGERRYRC